MNKTVKTILLAAAYALLLAALLASFLAVGLQMNQSRKDAEENAALQKELSTEILLLQEEYDAISSETQALKAVLEEKNLQLDALTAENGCMRESFPSCAGVSIFWTDWSRVRRAAFGSGCTTTKRHWLFSIWQGILTSAVNAANGSVMTVTIRKMRMVPVRIVPQKEILVYRYM